MIRDCLRDRRLAKRHRYRHNQLVEVEDERPTHSHERSYPTIDDLNAATRLQNERLIREIMTCRTGGVSWSVARLFTPRYDGYEERSTDGMRIGDMVPSTTVDRWPCWRKERYKTKEESDRHLRQLVASGKSRTDPESLESYQCRECGGFHVGHNRIKERPMRDVRSALSNGGVVTVFLGKDYNLPDEFARHPQVRAVTANELSPYKARGELDGNTRAVILTNRITPNVWNALKEELDRRHILYALRITPEALNNTLADIFDRTPPDAGDEEVTEEVVEAVAEPVMTDEPVVVAPVNGNHAPVVRPRAPRHVVPNLIEEHWSTVQHMTPTEAARHLFPIAQQRQIPTTPASIEQAFRVRRQTNTPPPPVTFTPEPPAAPKPTSMSTVGNERLEVLRVLDNTIAGLQLVREYVAAAETREKELQEKVDSVKTALSALGL